MHTFESSQLFAAPWQNPVAPQTSDAVHSLPSSHDAPDSAECPHPLALHVSLVHSLPSSQSSVGPALQAPPAHTSPTVQVSPSLHGFAFGVCTHPVPGAHESSVHTFESSQSSEPDLQLPPLQTSPDVQALPSSQGAPSSNG